jgi:hypothetical protein
MSETPVTIEVGEIMVHMFPDTMKTSDDGNITISYNVSNKQGDIIEDFDESVVETVIQTYFSELLINMTQDG